MIATTPIFRVPQGPTYLSPDPPDPLPSAESDLWIFRDGGKTISGPAMLAELCHQISRMGAHPESLLDVLIQAGQLEAALADTGPADTSRASALTDALAWALVSRSWESPPLELAARIQPPESISVSPPEGFTYYAVHPADFARIVPRIPRQPSSCAVIGVRSIGTTLSAMTLAGLRAEGRKSSRITVRPTGHPYARTTEFSDSERRWIEEQNSRPAQFLIVDEGPGRSGSTFLSVAEALVRAGVGPASITLVGTHRPNPASLFATQAARRWQAFRFLAAIPSMRTQFGSYRFIGGGEWRRGSFPDPKDWPESWTQMERLKFIAPNSRTLVKFEGMGAAGRENRERASALAEAGFSPPVLDGGDGFLEYLLVSGRCLRRADLSTRVLERIAEYCAFRASAFRSRQPISPALQEMLQFNVRQEFGVELSLLENEFLRGSAVLCDGRMQPYEWIATDADALVKTDGISHGDDHFFPGVSDIRWDLAGAAIEWKLGADGLAYLLEQFRRRSGTEVSNDIQPYLLAYCIFRLGYCKMAVSTVQGSDEEQRLKRAYHGYRRQAAELITSIANGSRAR